MSYDQILSVLEGNEYSVFENETGKLKRSSDEIWSNLEKLLKGKITAPTIYLNFLKNRGNLLNKLMEKAGLSQDEYFNKNKNISDSESSSDEYDMDDFEEDSNNFNFKIYLTFDDFRQLKPETRSYERGIYTKSYTSLKPHHWTSFFYSKIWGKKNFLAITSLKNLI